MPKKTKKQKIISDYRKKMSAISSSVAPISPGIHSSHIYAQSPQTIPLPHIEVRPTVSSPVVQSLVPPDEFKIIKKDLVTTLVITACILIGEFAVAWFIRF